LFGLLCANGESVGGIELPHLRMNFMTTYPIDTDNSYIYTMETIKDFISINSEVLGGQPVFNGTRVPVESLFAHLEKGISLTEFLEDFPSVSKEQAVKVLEIAGRILTSKNIADLYEAAA
jgi:uncharacterized protein (DUF433 family)